MRSWAIRHTSILSAISIAFGLGLTQNAVAALDRAPVPIKSFNVYSGKYYLAASFSSGSCFSSTKVIFRDPTGKTVNARRSSEKNYPYLTVYLSAIPLDAQCFKGDEIAFATSAPFKVKTNEIRDYTTKKVLWNSSNAVLTPVSPADPPVVDPFLSFTAARYIYCETCSAFTREIALIEVNRKGESAFTPLSSQVGYHVVGRNSDALIVQNRSLNFAMPFLELWLIKPSGWELLARDTFGARDSIQLSSNLQNLIYPASQGLAVGKTALFSLSIEVSINKRGNEKELFNVKKYGGGFISDLSLSPNDKFAYFTHISRGISSLYQVNLSNSKVSKVGKTIDGFNLEAIDSEGNLIGIIKKKASDESAQGIVKVSLRTLSKAQNIETDPFIFRTNSGPAVIAVGKYLIFNDEATGQLTIIDSTEVEPTLTLSLQSPVDFLSPLPVNWDSKTAIPAIPDINITVKE
jgi:hypothetical protein